jgi:hypothetical protein
MLDSLGLLLLNNDYHHLRHDPRPILVRRYNANTSLIVLLVIK